MEDNIIEIQEVVNKKPKNGKSLIAAVIFLLLVIAGLCIFIVVDNNRKQEEARRKEYEAEVPLTDEAMRDKINTTLAVIHDIEPMYASEFRMVLPYMDSANADIFAGKEISEEAKLLSIFKYLRRVDNGLENVEDDDYKVKEVQKWANVVTKDMFLEYGKRVSGEKVRKIYDDVYGGSAELKTVEACGGAYYSEETGYFYLDFIGGCGGMDFRHVHVLKDEYKKKADEYLINTYVVSVYSEPDAECAVFNDFYANVGDLVDNMKAESTKEKIYKTCKPTNIGGSDFVFNKTDIDHAGHYLYHFDQNARFKSIEKLEK